MSPGREIAAHRVQVGAVVVQAAPRAVKDVGDLGDVLLEQAERRGVGQHQPGGVRPHHRPQILDVDVAAGIGLDVHQRVAGHRDARGIGAVGGVGNHDLAADLVLATLDEVGAHDGEAGELPLRTRRRLQRHRIQPDHVGEHPLEPPHQLERALGAVIGLVGMQIAEPGKVHQPLADPRVVLHRARAERIKAGVDAERPRRELGEMPYQLGLGQLRPAAAAGPGRTRPEARPGGHRDGESTMLVPTRLRALVDQLHAPTSAQHLRQTVDVRRESAAR